MRIGMLAPIAERVPPKRYGGTERVVHALTEELVRRGHDVTLFASGDSQTSAKLSSVYPFALSESEVRDPYGANPWTTLHIGACYAMQDEFDVIHDHLVPLSMPVANIATTPVIATMHWPFNEDNRTLFRTLKHPNIVTISNAQWYLARGINHAATVYNGLSMEEFPFSNDPDAYLLFVGRTSREKGLHLAIEAAQRLHMQLKIAAKIDTTDLDYFEKELRPHFSKQIQWLGDVDTATRNHLMAKALCLLHPVQWPEPFGLVLIEALACGCPVIGQNIGSIPEVVLHRKTGFVVNGIDEMMKAVREIGAIDRSYCRGYVLTHFSDRIMADGYEAAYNRILKTGTDYHLELERDILPLKGTN